MAGYLAYWKDYWHQISKTNNQPHWSTDSEMFYKAVHPGDTIWGVITDERDMGKWKLLWVVVVKKRRPNNNPKYHRYYFVADQDRSRTFNLDQQPDLTPILWLLQFNSGHSIGLSGARIGRALQSHGYRQLSHQDVALLQEYADVLVKHHPGNS
ncbi:MAG: hypothetical protein M1434_14585 [Chloroflexi bacterium]|nr:hypothetical protein [Chloroflexota bacterium]MCL5275945.1 hypothetical protein [Chloroflexota bacterium]